jgi:DNA-binding NarL/FixJ family response regulator
MTMPAVTEPTLGVAIVDDQPITRSGLEQLTASVAGLAVQASVASIEELDKACSNCAVVVLNVPSCVDGLALKSIEQIAETSRPLVISTWERPPSVLAAIRAGACGCLTRQSDHRAVSWALTVVAAGGFYLCEELLEQFHHELSRQPGADPHGLAPREVETLRWIARGFTHGQIATRMGLSLATVDTYAKRIRRKLNVNNKADLTRIAIEQGHLAEVRRDRGVA